MVSLDPRQQKLSLGKRLQTEMKTKSKKRNFSWWDKLGSPFERQLSAQKFSPRLWRWKENERKKRLFGALIAGKEMEVCEFVTQWSYARWWGENRLTFPTHTSASQQWKSETEPTHNHSALKENLNRKLIFQWIIVVAAVLREFIFNYIALNLNDEIIKSSHRVTLWRCFSRRNRLRIKTSRNRINIPW